MHSILNFKLQKYLLLMKILDVNDYKAGLNYNLIT